MKTDKRRRTSSWRGPRGTSGPSDRSAKRNEAFNQAPLARSVHGGRMPENFRHAMLVTQLASCLASCQHTLLLTA